MMATHAFPPCASALGFPPISGSPVRKTGLTQSSELPAKCGSRNLSTLYAKGDIGGFGAASDFTWQIGGGLEFQITRWLYSDVGWRYLKYDYTSGGFTNKTELNGPFIEMGVSF